MNEELWGEFLNENWEEMPRLNIILYYNSKEELSLKRNWKDKDLISKKFWKEENVSKLQPNLTT